MLRRFGLPDHFVNVVIRLLHKNAKIKVKVGEVGSELESSIGVRLGSCEGPKLFLFIMQAAAMETMKWPVPTPEFRGSLALEPFTCRNNRAPPALFRVK